MSTDKCIFFDKRDLSFVMHRRNFEVKNALVSKRSTLLSWYLDINLVPLMPDEDKWLFKLGFENLMTSRAHYNQK